MKPIYAASFLNIARKPLPGRSAVIRIADDTGLLAEPYDRENVVDTLDCIFADDATPTEADAKRIAAFLREAENNPRVECIVAQCQAGIGRSVAIAAAYSEANGKPWEQMAVYNRTLYRLLLSEFRRIPRPEPLVSLAVRVKYDAETLMAFLISLRKQRYDNWQAVLFTDGQRPDIRQLVETMPNNNIVLMETGHRKGRWGHPYRQQAMELCEGEWIGTNNDDNYLTPGYIEQMVLAGQRSGAQLVLCSAVHRYSAWGACKTGQDLSCWLAHKDLLRQVKWKDTDFLADQKFLDKLIDAAGGKVAEVPRLLVVKN